MSTNLSKQKREDLLNKIEQIRIFLNQSLYDENARKLSGYLNELTTEINGQKYGLVFEEHKEGIDYTLENNLPVLTEEKELFVNNGGEINFLIEGDNLASLQLLEKTHKDKIDVIYIDPPYNTGNKDFIYDDDFVDANDTFRHSKWCSFLYSSLELSKNLLSDKGVILISIDDNEVDNLKMICNSLFGDTNNLGIFIVKSTPNARDYGFVGKMHEYILFYAKNSEKVETNLMPIIDKTFKYKDTNGGFNIHPLYNSNEAFTNKNRPNLFYPFYLNPVSQNNDFYEISLEEKKGWIEIYPPKSVKNGVQFVWRWGKDKSFSNLNKEIVGYKVSDGEYRIVQKMRHDEKLIRSILDNSEYTSRKGTAELENIFNKKMFSFPKPILLMKDLLFMATQKESTILDFFAGSGTTGHAVIKLNSEDGGHRKFILCTNNENSICRDITYQRLKTVITGKRKDGSTYSDGLPGSLKYFKVDFVEITEKEYYEYADRLLLHVRELVELEDAVNFEGNSKISIVLTEEELELFFTNHPDGVNTLYLGHDVLLSKEQKSLLKKSGIEVKIIPQYYYPELNG